MQSKSIALYQYLPHLLPCFDWDTCFPRTHERPGSACVQLGKCEARRTEEIGALTTYVRQYDTDKSHGAFSECKCRNERPNEREPTWRVLIFRSWRLRTVWAGRRLRKSRSSKLPSLSPMKPDLPSAMTSMADSSASSPEKARVKVSAAGSNMRTLPSYEAVKRRVSEPLPPAHLQVR